MILKEFKINRCSEQFPSIMISECLISNSLSGIPPLCSLPWEWPEGLTGSKRCSNLDEYSKTAIMTSALMTNHMDKNTDEFKKCPGKFYTSSRFRVAEK